ncbi:hypothetical protein [Candidatus Tisiphia endosymbiont of Nemotelus uliginosus]|uniref:hypothetical protein n=1 Tax=Candidatus Tisiphia endosymbiont of Nemotelus uliginosus TaxID=3077926 RepID=UPI0035C9097C
MPAAIVSLLNSSGNVDISILPVITHMYGGVQENKDPLYNMFVILALGFTGFLLIIVGVAIFREYSKAQDNNGEEVELDHLNQNINQNGHHLPVGGLEALVIGEAIL